MDGFEWAQDRKSSTTLQEEEREGGYLSYVPFASVRPALFRGPGCLSYVPSSPGTERNRHAAKIFILCMLLPFRAIFLAKNDSELNHRMCCAPRKGAVLTARCADSPTSSSDSKREGKGREQTVMKKRQTKGRGHTLTAESSATALKPKQGMTKSYTNKKK